MPLDHSLIGIPSEPHERSWTSTDALLITGRALLHAVCGSDPARLRSMSGRFSHPEVPGDTLVVSIWLDDGGALFQTARQDGTVVIDRGRMRVRD